MARAWSAFADDEARTPAPPALEARVRNAWRAARDAGTLTQPRCAAPRIGGWRQHVLPGVAAAAVAAIVSGAALVYLPPDVTPASPAARAPGPAALVSPVVPPPSRPAAAAAPRIAATAVDDAPAVVHADMPDAVLTLAADPLITAESLQLIRVRVPRQALQSLGVVLIDPDAEGTVEIDVLVGGDGLPRDIRRVEAAQESQP